jgi:DegV family protein with EDD domain
MAEKFILMTDDACDMPDDFYKQNNIPLVHLSFTIDDQNYDQTQMDIKEFYRHIRAGKMPVTSAVNPDQIIETMEPLLADGNDILYLAFSSGLSVTAQSGMYATDELQKKYPERKIICIDTLCASLGEGLLVFKANQMKQAGATIDEVASWAMQNRLKLAHYVVADDLMHLHRGGRVSRGSAILGGLIGIKPIIYVDNAGKLIAIGKVRGKKQALNDIVERTIKCIGDANPDYFMVCHSDSIEDAEYTAALFSKKTGIKDYLINYIGPVIGSHTGAGTIALFVIGSHR